jgi:hypothetical protein
LTNGTLYHFVVSGVNASGEGANSAEASARPVSLVSPQLMLSASGEGVLELSWPQENAGWRLEAQTNDLSAGLGTNWVSIPGSDQSNSFLVFPEPGTPSVFYRLVYP